MPEQRETWQFHHVHDSLRNLEMGKRSETNAYESLLLVVLPLIHYLKKLYNYKDFVKYRIFVKRVLVSMN